MCSMKRPELSSQPYTGQIQRNTKLFACQIYSLSESSPPPETYVRAGDSHWHKKNKAAIISHTQDTKQHQTKKKKQKQKHEKQRSDAEKHKKHIFRIHGINTLPLQKTASNEKEPNTQLTTQNSQNENMCRRSLTAVHGIPSSRPSLSAGQSLGDLQLFSVTNSVSGTLKLKYERGSQPDLVVLARI